MVLIEKKTYHITTIREEDVEDFGKTEEYKRNEFATKSMEKFNSKPLTKEKLEEIKKRYNEFSDNN